MTCRPVDLATSTVGPLTKTVRETYGEVAICKIAQSQKLAFQIAEETSPVRERGNL